MNATQSTPTQSETFYATRDDGSRYAISMPFYRAPNCDSDGLAHPPHIEHEPDGTRYLMLEGDTGIGPERERVLQVERLEGGNRHGHYDLALVLTEAAAYLMRGADVDRQLPRKTRTRLDDLTSWADDLCSAMTAMVDDDALEPPARLLWKAGFDLTGSPAGSSRSRLGFTLVLAALAASPNVLAQACRELRRQLVEADPTLALATGQAGAVGTDAPPLPDDK